MKRGIWKGFAAAAAVIGLGIFAWHSYGLYQQRKENEAQAALWQSGEPAKEEEMDWNKIEFQDKTYRRNTYVKAVLCMGVDRSGALDTEMVAGSGGQADGIFLVAQDTARDAVKVLMIPRDTMTPITLTDLSGNVLAEDVQHLTLAYAYGDGREKSCEYMRQAVSGLLGGFPIDGYMAISLSALPILNDGVGGVTVTIDNPELSERDPALVYGSQVTLKGDQAELFLRYRNIEVAQSALDRMERQKQYIEGFALAARKQASREEGFAARMLEEIQPYMITDLTKDQYMELALPFLEGSGGLSDDVLITLPGEAVETNLYDEYYPDKEEILPIILDMFYRVEE